MVFLHVTEVIEQYLTRLSLPIKNIKTVGKSRPTAVAFGTTKLELVNLLIKCHILAIW